MSTYTLRDGLTTSICISFILILLFIGQGVLLANNGIALTIESGRLNDYNLIPSNPIVLVVSGQSVYGDVDLLVTHGFDTYHLAWAATWLDHQSGFEDLYDAGWAQTNKRIGVDFNLNSPNTPGTYYIWFVMAQRDDFPELISCDDPAAWNDGDDIADMGTVEYESLLKYGKVKWYFNNNPFDYHAIQALKIEVVDLPTIKVLYPNGGEYLLEGVEKQIKWITTDSLVGATVKIYLTTNGGEDWSQISTGTPSDGIQDWVIPNNPSSKCKIRITNLNGTILDESDDEFTIVSSSGEGTVLILPNGGEEITVGIPYDITWVTSLEESMNIKVEYTTNYKASGFINWQSIIDSTPNNGTYTWTVPNAPSANCKVRLNRWQWGDLGVLDESDSVFSIISPSITLTSPTGGEKLITGTNHDISWTSVGFIDGIKIEYTIDNGNSWITIVSSTNNDGDYSWQVPDMISANCKVRISEATDGEPADESSAIFEIISTPVLPVVTTNTVSSISSTSAVCGGNVTSDGGTSVTARGVCWSTQSNPSVSGNKTTDGNGRGNFISNISGLKSNTTYYVRAYAANSTGTAYGAERMFVTDPPPISTHILTVKSLPYTGIEINVSPIDQGGNADGSTDFNRTYSSGEEVTLTAPAFFNDKKFTKWVVDGADSTDLTVTVTMDSDHTAQAVYESPTYTLAVQSSPDTGAKIIVDPKDNNGKKDGLTNFIRTYNSGRKVSLTAPASYKGRKFLKWQGNGSSNSNRTIGVSMNKNRTIQAVYQSDTYTLYVQSSPYTAIGITVNPSDEDGNGDGHTNFTRTYNSGTNVTLTAPSSISGSNFIKWSVNGLDYSNTSTQVTMEGDQTAVVLYESSYPPEIAVNRTSLNVGYIIGSNRLPVENLTIYNGGGGTLNWNVSTEMFRIGLSPTTGTNWGTVEITMDPKKPGPLIPGKYRGVTYVSSPLVSNSPLEIEIKLWIKAKASPPFGEFATPVDNSTVYSSIPVTGWVLGDTGIDSVKIYREANSGLVYIGDAVMVEGARPDVETTYPDYPMNYKAGWGYMLLTNFLPNSGNGTFKLHAIATDKEGLTKTLGIKTIHVDNANAVKPFGAIDTPTQGGVASGSKFINWGWTLTPQPNKIPIDGSKIKVFVDGVNIGNPTYNIYRSDIAGFFPGYANSDGAVGYFYLDTTAYKNGVHTMQWVATDSGGNTDGIGSRYFTIQNTGGISKNSSSTRTTFKHHDLIFNGEISTIPLYQFTPIGLVKGCIDNASIQPVFPNEDGSIKIEIKELERTVLYFFPQDILPTNMSEKFPLLHHETRVYSASSLPIGSTFDSRRGAFYWQPGAGFYGDYQFDFIKQKGLNKERVRVKIKIVPMNQ